MLVNRSVWICLLFLFIICGCGVSHKKFDQFKNSVEKAQADTEQELKTLEKGLETAKKKLEGVDRELKGQVQSVKDAQADTEQELKTLEKGLEAAKKGLETAKKKLEGVDRELKGQVQSVKDAQTDTEQELKTLEKRLETIKRELQLMVEAHDKIKEKLADVQVKHDNLLKVDEPFIEEYFDLGKLLIEHAKIENDVSKKKELIEKAIKHLTKVAESNNKNYSVDAYCYIANTHYYHRSYDLSSGIDAHKAVMKAKELATQTGYQKTQDIFDEAQIIFTKTKREYEKHIRELN